jgi:hypothetical protein
MYHRVVMPVGGVAAGAGGAALAGSHTTMICLLIAGVTLIVGALSMFALLPKLHRNVH